MIGLKRALSIAAITLASTGMARGADIFSDTPLSYKDGSSNFWVVTVGGYVGAEEAYPGAKTYSFAFRPIVDVHRAGEKEWLSLPNDSISITLSQGANYRFGLAGDYYQERNHHDDSELRGLRDVNYSLEVGGFAEYYVAPALRTRVEVLQAVTGHDGLLVNLSADYIFRPAPRWQFTVGPRLQFSNTQFESTFFSVNAVESQRSGLPGYHASGGLNSAGADATLQYDVSKRLSLRAFADWERLVGDGADSPIVKFRGSENQFEFGIGAAYTFNYHP